MQFLRILRLSCFGWRKLFPFIIIRNPSKGLKYTDVHPWSYTPLSLHYPLKSSKTRSNNLNWSCVVQTVGRCMHAKGEISKGPRCPWLDDWGVDWYSSGPSGREPCVLSNVSGLNLAPRWIPVHSQTPQAQPAGHISGAEWHLWSMQGTGEVICLDSNLIPVKRSWINKATVKCYERDIGISCQFCFVFITNNWYTQADVNIYKKSVRLFQRKDCCSFAEEAARPLRTL